MHHLTIRLDMLCMLAMVQHKMTCPVNAGVVAIASRAPSGNAGSNDVGQCTICAGHIPHHGWYLFADQLMHALAG